MTTIYQNDNGSWVFIAQFVSAIDAAAFLTQVRGCRHSAATPSGNTLVYLSDTNVEYKTVEAV